MTRYLVLISLLLAVCSAAPQFSNDVQPTPTPILKQISRANEDGSYTYGYEGGDGSFKIETRYPTGEVVGKYGYVDSFGNLKTVEYGANKLGFQPSGEGITVAPPTLPQEGNNYDDGQYDDGQYREDTSRSFQQQPLQQQTFSNIHQDFTFQQPRRQQQSFNTFQQPRQQQSFSSFQQPRQAFNSQPTVSNLPVNIPASIFNGHPASNIDLASGSYVVRYGG